MDMVEEIRRLVEVKGRELGNLELAKYLAIESIKCMGTEDGSAEIMDDPPREFLCPRGCGGMVADAFEHADGCPEAVAIKDVMGETVHQVFPEKEGGGQ